MTIEAFREALRYWVERFDTAADQARVDVAIVGLSWLVPNHAEQATIRDFSAAIGNDVELMKRIREMIWRIPSGHGLFEKNPDLSDGIQTPGEWICDQLDHSVSISGWDRVRDLWLQRTPAERLSTLLYLGGNPAAVAKVPSFTDPLLQTAAWMVAEEDGLSVSSVVAATNVTLYSYRNQYNVNGQLDGPHQIQNAINITLARSDGAHFAYRTTEQEAQAILAEHPHACVRMLRFIQQNSVVPEAPVKQSRWPKRAEPAQAPDAALSALTSWLPTRAATIGTMQMMGHSYREVLDYLVDEIAVEIEVCALPTNIGSGMPS